METGKNTWKRGAEYWITGAVICMFFVGVCAVKAVFPFGENTLDTVDFESQWVPAYYHVWDFLHGRADLFFDWRVGGGNNFAGVSAQFTLISPFNLFFLLIARGWIEKSMLIFILIKLVAMGTAMCFFLKNIRTDRRAEPYFRIAGSVAYALSGYSFLYYGMGWLDTAVFFPLLLYSFVRMVRAEDGWRIGKYTVFYTLCYALIFIMNIPQAYMVSFYMMLFAGGYFFLLREKNRIQTGGILKFGLATLLALGLSAAVFLPAALAMLGSKRLSGEEFSGVPGYFLLLRQAGMDARLKWLMLSGVAIPLFCVMATGKRSRRALWEFYLTAAMVIPVIFEAVNLLWHRGTYVCFPMRYGYMMIFTIIFVAAERIEERCMEGKRYKKSVSAAVIGVWAVILLALGNGLIAPLSHGGEVNFVSDAEEVGTLLAGKTDLFHKTKTADLSINHNYPLISDVVSYSNYLHLMTAEQIALNQALGYAQVWTRLGDAGGTLFSDVLLGYAYTLDSKFSLQEEFWNGSGEIYEELGETTHFRAFQNRYCYGPGLRVSRSAYEAMDQTYSPNVFDHQNLLSRLFFGTDMIETWAEDVEMLAADGAMRRTVRVEGKKALYLYGSGIPGVSVKVNGRDVLIPSYEDPDGTVYPSSLNNGILALGMYEGEEVEIILKKEVDWDVSGTVYFGMLDMGQFARSVSAQGGGIMYETGKNFCRITADSTGEEYLYLPMNADDGWHVSVNGSERKMEALCGNLVLIPMDRGENEILLTYMPRGMKKGGEATAGAMLVLVIWAVLSRIKRVDACLGWLYGKLSCAAAAAFFVCCLGFLLWLYVIPIGYTFYLKIMG